MTGGIVVQVVIRDTSIYVEILDRSTFGRCWRLLHKGRCKASVKTGDILWWQSNCGCLSRQGQFTDNPVGSCIAADNPLGKRK